MSSRLNYLEQSSSQGKKLFELGHAIKESTVDQNLHDLINIRASQLNGCAFCLDMHVKEAKIHGERELRVYHVSMWRESTLFSDKEKAALEWTEAVTKLSDQGITDEIYQRTLKFFSEKEISDLTYAIGLINMWNRLNISFRTVPGAFDTMLGLTKAGLK